MAEDNSDLDVFDDDDSDSSDLVIPVSRLVPFEEDDRYMSIDISSSEEIERLKREKDAKYPDPDYTGEGDRVAQMMLEMAERHARERFEENRQFRRRVREETEVEYVRLVARREAYRLLDGGQDRAAIARLPTPVTPAQMLEMAGDTPKYRVDRLIPSGANTLLCARPKAGKTERGFQLAGSMLTGEPFLGEFDIEPISGSVLVLNYELTQDMTAEWMSDLNLTAHDRLFTLNLRGQTVPLLSDDGAGWLIDLCRTYGVEVLMIDPAARMMTAAGKHDENDNNAVKSICDRLDFIKAEAGVSEMIVAIHASRTDPVCRPRGADAWTGWMDSQINFEFKNLESTSGPRYISAVGRDVSLPKHELAYDKSTREAAFKGRHQPDTDENGDPLTTQVIDFSQTRTGRGNKVTPEEYDERVRAYLTANPGASVTQVRKHVKGSADRVDAAYRRVVDQMPDPED